MKEKLIKLYKSNSLEVKTAGIVFVVGLIILTTIILISSNDLKHYQTDTYTIKYDKNWHIKKKTQNTIELKHNSKSKINIEIMTLDEEYKYLDSKDLIDELLYSIGLENKNYKLLQKKQANITKSNYDGYKVLYEDDKNQVMAVMAKKSDKVMLFTYQATNEYFDILLDSVQSIIYNFDIKDEEYKVNNTVTIDTKKITWKENNKISKSLKKNKSYEIANNNYSVNLSIPGNFKISNFESTYGYYNYKDLETGSINLTISIYEKNIFEYLKKEDTYGTLYNEYKTQREKTNKSYSKFTETLTKLDNEKHESYLYKSTYNYNGISNISKYENYYIIYELDENHILIFKLISIDNVIPKDLIDSLKFSKVTNYSSNVEKVIKEDKLIGTLRRFTDYTKTKYNEITIKLPTIYKEFDRLTNNNVYRYYSKNYDSKNDIYEYDVKYTLTDTNDKSKLISNVTIYTNTGSYQSLTSNGQVTLNGKTFDIYSGGYNDYGPGYKKNSKDQIHYVNKQVLLYQLENKGHLIIEINGNGQEISNEVLNDLTNVDIMIKEY